MSLQDKTNIQLVRLLSIGTIILAVLVLIRSFKSIYVEAWSLTHWTFNYENNFIKRGIPGELFRLSGVDFSVQSVSIVSYVSLFALIVLLCWTFAKPLSKDRERTGLWLFLLLAMASPATIQHFLFDVGRFDIFTLLLAMSCLFIIRSFDGPLTGIALFLCMGAATLIHEASFFMYTPMVMTYWVYRDPGIHTVLPKLLVFLGLLLVTYLASTYGQVDSSHFEPDLLALRAEYGDWVKDDSLAVIYKGSVIENIRLTLASGFSLRRLIDHVLMIAFVLLPLVVLLFRVLVPEKHTGGSRVYSPLFLSAFGPLLLYPLGHDHFRWWSLAITNLFILISLTAWQDKELRNRLACQLFDRRKLLLAVLALSIIFGPLGVTKSFNPKIIKARYKDALEVLNIVPVAPPIQTTNNETSD